MNGTYDLIVIGAGPAGLMAAVTGARANLRVALIDRKTDISAVNRSCCTALITEPGTHGEFVSLENDRIVFHRSDFSVPYEGPRIPLEQMVKFSPGGNRFVVAREEDPVAIALNKECLLEGLAALAYRAGVAIITGASALKAENRGDGVVVTVQQRDTTHDLTSRMAIIADGVNSRLTETLGLNRGRKHFGTMQALSFYLENVDCPYPPAWMVFVGKGQVPSGKGQLYVLPKPRKDGSRVFEVTYGHPASNTSSMEEDVRWFLEKGIVSSWFKKARIVKTLSAVLRFSTPLLEPRAGNILIAGDAASYIEVYNQGALMYGHSAATAVATFLETGNGLENYLAFWKETFGYNQPGAIEAAVQAFGLHVLDDQEIDYLFSLTDKEIYRGYVNEHSSRETTMGAVRAHWEEIERDRPELAAKIDRFDQISSEEFLQVGKEGTR